ncbi:LuxR C-terminal-related transcriptional regulator [Streptomyces yangpuensis]|uniref:LuxR C-terminal-related transcriptional regulator n=1 Tax=Streptomyces yangpuensis TaxID=1648182 RepID=UPI003651286C
MTASARPLPSDSGRVLDVLTLLAEGYTLQQIAHDWGVGPGTVRIYAARMRRYLGAETNAQAVLLACRAGILDGRRQERHGDHAGYAAHVRRGEDPKQCEPCAAGERAYRAAQRARQRPSAPTSAPISPRTSPN